MLEIASIQQLWNEKKKMTIPIQVDLSLQLWKLPPLQLFLQELLYWKDETFPKGVHTDIKTRNPQVVNATVIITLGTPLSSVAQHQLPALGGSSTYAGRSACWTYKCLNFTSQPVPGYSLHTSATPFTSTSKILSRKMVTLQIFKNQFFVLFFYVQLSVNY